MSTPNVSVREFIVELLGVLVPGLLVVLLSALVIGWPIWAISRASLGSAPAPDPATLGVQFLTAFRFELLALLLVTSYVVGHLLYRQDPKVPDEHSYRRTSRKFKPHDHANWVVRATADESTDVQYPYLHLKEYLQHRGLDHLALLVPWSGDDPSTHSRRTKSCVNVLKIRLAFSFPDKYGSIARNEAHIRLMSSIWYGAWALAPISLIVLLGCLVSMLAPIGISWFSMLPPMALAVAILASSLIARITIERFLHYQRVREIIFVLETAYIAALQFPGLRDGLGAPLVATPAAPGPAA